MKDEQQIRPFSNGTEFMCWLDNNCDRCVKAFKPKNGIIPDYKNTQRLVNLGLECKMKFAIDFSSITGEIPISIAKEIGYSEENGLSGNCMFFSDDNDDNWQPTPKKPKDAPDCQMCLPFAINEIVLNKSYEHA